jgi:integrase
MSERGVTVYVLRPRDRPTLQLQWVDPDTGARKTRSAGTDDPAAAQRAAADLEYQLNHGLYQEASRLDWHRFRELFEAEYLAGLRPRTREKFNCVLDVFEPIVNPAKVRAVNERTLSLFVKGMRERKQPPQDEQGRPGPDDDEERPRGPQVGTRLGGGPEAATVAPHVPEVKVPKKKPQPIPAESFERLLAKAPDALWRAYLLCGWWAELRLSEARELRWQQSEAWPWIDLERNRIVLPAVFAKSAQDQSVPLHAKLRQALAELPRTGELVFPFRSRRGGGRLSRNGITNRVLLMARQAGVKLSKHKLRKGFGCRVAKTLGKGNAPVLRELMRHSSMQITTDYYASVDVVLQDAINELS